jgi:peptide/nickel transport system substrate-binding protein
VTPLADPARSRALLVGVSGYDKMAADRQLPTVEPGLYRLAELLCDERIWGLPAGNCTVLHQPASADDIVSALRTAAAAAQDALVFYYAGHGLEDPAVRDGELHLALPGAYEPGGTHLAMSYQHVRRELKVSRGSRRVVILDCCWSGLALAAGLAGAAAIEGTAVLTATAATRQALAPPGERYPAFTGTLIDLLASGIPGEPQVLDLGTLHRHADDRLARKGRPRPQFLGMGDGARIPLARNLAYRQAPGPRPAVGAATRVRALRRAGRYREADQLQQEAAAAGEPESLRGRAEELRRIGRYADAAGLEDPHQP